MGTMTVKVLKIVVASPGDVQNERDKLEAIATELNRGSAADRGLRLEVVRWETRAYPGFDPAGPQGLIDPIINIPECDLLIGIFWKRFGTPTKNAKSGTEHEFRTAYKAWKETGRPQIMVYFNQKSYNPTSKQETDQWGQVLQFQQEFPEEGLWWAYEGADAFEALVRNHLTQYIRQRYPLAAPAPVGAAGGLGPVAESPPAEDDRQDPEADDPAPPEVEAEGVKFFISYAHGDPDEEYLAVSLTRRLGESGYQTFVDEKIKAGTDWLEEIKARIRWCDYLVVLLSENSMDSEMVLEEVRMAHQIQRRQGRPHLIPVRVRYQGPLEYELHNYLGHLQYVVWDGADDTEGLLDNLLNAMQPVGSAVEEPAFAERLEADRQPRVARDPIRPRASADARVLFVPDGSVRLDDPYYIRRCVDEQAEARAAHPFSETLVIKGPQQMGKSSLLIRYRVACREAGKKEAFVDFSRFSEDDFKTYPTFLSRLGMALQQRLRLGGDKPVIDSQWDMVTFVEEKILDAVNGPLVIAFDEVDRVYKKPYQTDFFTMLRNWHNNRTGLEPRWEMLDLALVISTEPYLLIDSKDRSPFNVGLVLEMQPFTYREHQTLCRRYHLDIDEDELWKLLKGHPYLTRLAFYRMAGPEKMSFDRLLDKADEERGPFGDHLRALLAKLDSDPKLIEAMRQVRYGEKPAPDLYHGLYGAGLVGKEEKDGRVNPANLLYDRFFKRAL